MASVKDYEKAIIECKGLVTRVAARLGVSRTAVYKAIERHPRLKEVLEDSRERLLDLAESKLFEAIDSGDVRAIALFLKTQGKHRGYTERQEQLVKATIDVTHIENMSDEELDAALEGHNLQ